MALDKMAGMTGANMGVAKSIEGVRGTGPGASGVKGPGIDGAEFKRALEQFAPTQTAQAPSAPKNSSGAEALKFSSHAIDRMRSRGINFAPEMMRDIEGAVSKAAAKGSKDTLVLAGDNALIVSVKNNTVVTVMDRAAMKDNVFTNIDSTVVI